MVKPINNTWTQSKMAAWRNVGLTSTRIPRHPQIEPVGHPAGFFYAPKRRRRPVQHRPPETTPDRRHLLSSSPRPQEAMAPRHALPRTIGRSIRRARVSPKCAGRRECDLPIRNAAGNPYRGVRAVQIGHAKREAQKSRDGQVRVSPLMARLSKPRRRGRLPVTTNPGNASPVCDRVKSHSVVATTVFPCF